MRKGKDAGREYLSVGAAGRESDEDGNMKTKRRMKMKIANQHGDLLLEVVDSIPEDAKCLSVKNGFVIERGEGVHTHVFPEVEGIEVYEKDGQIYVRVNKETQLDHEEHGRQTVKPGIYRKCIERVFDYESMEARKVID
jgi:hypothetical protein